MIKDIINKLHSELPAAVKLAAVSKFHPFESIEEAYAAGQRIFAESRPQELAAKVARLEAIRAERGEPGYMADIEWHFIGHLQTNKLKMVLPYVSMIQSVDSMRLLEAINSWGGANGRVIDVLLEPHVAAEETKQGFSPDEIHAILAAASRFPNIRFRGIMGMATFTEDEAVIRADFAELQSIFNSARALLAASDHDSDHGSGGSDGSCGSLVSSFTELSIGMSDDYPLAIEYGSTMVRIGSLIFGARQY